MHGVQVDMDVYGVITDQVNRDVDEFKAEFHRHVQELTGLSRLLPEPRIVAAVAGLVLHTVEAQG